jgi:transposase
MIRKGMYQKIQNQKNQGLSISEISRLNKLDRKTTRKYYSMSIEEYEIYNRKKQSREKYLDQYKDSILKIYKLNNNKKLNMSAVFDYLEEKDGKIKCTEKTLRNYINNLILNNDIKLKSNIRMVEKVEELPMGKQMQVDFGQFEFPSGLKIYIFASVLSSSRYKYVSVQDKPFKTQDVIQHLINCFEYIGGIPEEIVIDQDSTLVVSENYGDIIYTKDFNLFKSEMQFSMYVCRKADPQSKGKIENLVGYVKKNFFSIRDYTDIGMISNDLNKWLTRRANGKISLSSGFIPLEIIKKEREFLKPIRSSIFIKSNILREERKVSLKSYISFKTCLYSVPVEFRNKTVEVELRNDELMIFFQKRLIASHKKSIFKGKIINMREHFRETSKNANTLKEEVLSLYDFNEWRNFVIINFKQYPRYVRDQSIYAKKYFSMNIDFLKLKDSIDYCIINEIYSFKNLYEIYNKYINNKDSFTDFKESKIKSIHSENSKINVKKRDVSFYSKIASDKGSVSYES